MPSADRAAVMLRIEFTFETPLHFVDVPKVPFDQTITGFLGTIAAVSDKHDRNAVMR